MAEIINRQNYEVYLIDYLEGTLSPALQAEVEAFLQRNPDIEQELEGLGSMRLDAPAVAYEHQAELRMVNHPEVGDMPELDYLCIAQLEGDLTPTEAERLRQLEQSQPAAVAASMQAMARTKLVAEPCVYAHKGQLKRRAVGVSVRQMWPMVASVAAAAVLVGVFVLGEGDSPVQPVAQPTEIAKADTPRVAPAEQIGAPANTVQPAQPVTTVTAVANQPRQAHVAQRGGIAQAQTQAQAQPSAAEVSEAVELAANAVAEPEIAPIRGIAARVELPTYFDEAQNAKAQMLADLNRSAASDVVADDEIFDDARKPLAERIIHLAHNGVQRVGRLMRFKGSVQRDNGGKITGVRLDGEHLAVVLPLKRND